MEKTNWCERGELVGFLCKYVKVYLWTKPASLCKNREDYPEEIELGSIGLVLDRYENSCKVLVNGKIGWVEDWDIMHL